jgi:hypothetical protein
MTATKNWKYTIKMFDGANWIWCADGDTVNGCFADLPSEVLDFADRTTGQIEVDGVVYQVYQLRGNI